MLFRSTSTRLTLGIVTGLIICLAFVVITRWQQPSLDLSSLVVSSNEIPADTESEAVQASETKLTPADEQTKARVIEGYGKLPLSFEANEGQIDSTDVKFLSRGEGYNLYLSPTSAQLVLSRPVASKDKDNPLDDDKTILNQDTLNRKLLREDGLAKSDPAQEIEQSIIGMNLVGANAASSAKGADELEGKINYFIGNDQSKWRTDVANYKKARFAEVYSGIDIEYYGNPRQLEYDFIVAPSADPNQIKLKFDGVKNLSVNTAGELVLETASGEQIKQRKPFIYQTQDSGERKEVAGNYTINGKEVGFELAEYDRSRELVIDPIVLVYSTYLGGRNNDYSNAIAVDSAGNAYITGETQSTDFAVQNPLASNARNQGNSDIFITKLSPSGTLVYSTYFGGEVNENGAGIAVFFGFLEFSYHLKFYTYIF
jgi:hypothetical protein